VQSAIRIRASTTPPRWRRLLKTREAVGQWCPTLHLLGPDHLLWRRKIWIGKGSNGDANQVSHPVRDPIEVRTATRTEVEGHRESAGGGAFKHRLRPRHDRHLLRCIETATLKALPVRRWQSKQQHIEILRGSPWQVTRRSPQWHLAIRSIPKPSPDP
jgi:hypothetical protein